MSDSEALALRAAYEKSEALRTARREAFEAFWQSELGWANFWQFTLEHKPSVAGAKEIAGVAFYSGYAAAARTALPTTSGLTPDEIEEQVALFVNGKSKYGGEK